MVARSRPLYEAVLVAVLLASLLNVVACSRSHASDAGSKLGQPSTAAVVKVGRKTLANRIQIASEFQPFQEVDIHAKVSGYIKSLEIDWGAHVKTGQLMAVLEVPELEQDVRHDLAAEQRSDQDLARANENVRRAQSNYEVAHVTYNRLLGVQKGNPELVAQEEIDQAEGKDRESHAGTAAAQDELAAARQEVEAAQATLARDQAMYAYARIIAPFDGVITQLYAYTGALLPASTSTSENGLALCHLAQNNLLRLVIPVPEADVPGVQIGETVQVNVSSLNRTFPGKVVRFSDQIDLDTRTMHTEVQVPNPQYQLVPGMYATVELPVNQQIDVLAVPLQAVQMTAPSEGKALVVNAQNKIERRQLKLGLATSTDVEVISGLEPQELVIFGEQSRYRSGQTVDPQLVSPPGF